MTEGQIPPIGYDEWFIPQVEVHLESADYSQDELESLIQYEEEHDDRKGAKNAIEEEMNDSHTMVESDSELNSDEEDESTSEEVQTEQQPSEADSDTSEDTVLVTPTNPLRASVAGLVFDVPGEPLEVELSPRIERAINNGYLEVVEE